ncbi:MAG: hypothetical protein RLZZ502_717 [Pseudomonadota bacterium]|jgi:pimeloyl-ACP methyl ester carboxylesterase
MRMDSPLPLPLYLEKWQPKSQFLSLRGLRTHLRTWSKPEKQQAERPKIIFLHGWMDVSASFQFLIDALPPAFQAYELLAPDWRGYGLTEPAPDVSGGYWFADYVADLDALVTALSPDRPVILIGHSLGGNIACIYAGIRPERVSKLVSLDGFGLRSNKPETAAEKFRDWLDAIADPKPLKSYPSEAAVAERLRKNNPLLEADKAHYLARHWSTQKDDGQYHLLADAAHKLPFSHLYRLEESLAIWRQVSAAVMWLAAGQSHIAPYLGYDQHAKPHLAEEFGTRLAAFSQMRYEMIAPASHMLHHEQEDVIATLLEDFLL